MRRVYLDHTATTPLDARVLEAMQPYFLEKYGNASSIHQFGQEAKAALDEARDKIARCIGASSAEVFFTGSGTEADNAVLKGAAWKMRDSGKSHIVTSAIEHHAVLESCAFLKKEGFDLTIVGVDSTGRVDPDEVQRSIKPTTGIISIMHGNNEVGTIQPIGEIAGIAREHGIIFHTDAVQTFGKIPLNVGDLGVDALSLSAHKIYGPKGIGAMYLRRGVNIDRFIHGGGQERGRRAGTENVPFAIGFAKATELIMADRAVESKRLQDLKERLQTLILDRLPAAIINGHPAQSLPHVLSLSFDSKQMTLDGEALLFNMDLAGVAVTNGSACTSGSIEPSHVLLAMGRDAQTAKATIRFSMGRQTTFDEIEYAVETLKGVVQRIGRKV